MDTIVDILKASLIEQRNRLPSFYDSNQARAKALLNGEFKEDHCAKARIVALQEALNGCTDGPSDGLDEEVVKTEHLMHHTSFSMYKPVLEALTFCDRRHRNLGW